MEPSTAPAVAAISTSEAAMNIFANLSEIIGIRYGIGFFVGAILILFLRKWSLAGKYTGLSFFFAAAGIGIPGLVNIMAGSVNGNTAMTTVLAVICGILAIVVLVGGLALLALPIRVAKERGRKNFRTLTILIFASLFIGILWSVALFLAHKSKPDEEDLGKNLLQN